MNFCNYSGKFMVIDMNDHKLVLLLCELNIPWIDN